jgi:hypothetical protein
MLSRSKLSIEESRDAEEKGCMGFLAKGRVFILYGWGKTGLKKQSG